jgi:hypothetical protein
MRPRIDIAAMGDQARERCLPMKRECVEMISPTVGICDSVTEVIRRVVPWIRRATFGVFEPPEPTLVCSYPAKHALDLAEERTDDPQTLEQNPNQWRVLGMVRLA